MPQSNQLTAHLRASLPTPQMHLLACLRVLPQAYDLAFHTRKFVTLKAFNICLMLLQREAQLYGVSI